MTVLQNIIRFFRKPEGNGKTDALVLFAIVSALSAPFAGAHETAHTPVTAPQAEALLRSTLEGAAGTEVILSTVALPPETMLPEHWHPGEEFAYVVSGSLTFYLDGEAAGELGAGDAGMVPLKRVHTIKTGPEGAMLVVFRVHEAGQPERVLTQ